MAGGNFVAIAVCAVFIFLFVIDHANRNRHLVSIIAALCAAAFGLSLILFHSSNLVTPSAAFNLVDFTQTFTKSMSWPNTPSNWPALVFATPVAWLVIDVIKQKISPTPLVRFTLCLYLLVVILALAIAIARAYNGEGPSRRYFEFLALGLIGSTLALLLIQQSPSLPTLKKPLVLVWVITILSALPFQIEIMRYTLEDRANTIPHQTQNVRQFLFQNDSLALLDKPFRHIPFHDGELLSKALIEFDQSNILPYQLQTPAQLTPSPESNPAIFIVNGAHSKNSDSSYAGTTMLGSYTAAEGMTATGQFTSSPFELTRPYMMLPSLGFFGANGLTINLKNLDTGATTTLVPVNAGMEFSDIWLENFYAVTPGNYTLTAQDLNPNSWFGFAAPRSVGTISYLGQQVLERGSLFWMLGLILLAISQHRLLFRMFSASKQTKH